MTASRPPADGGDLVLVADLGTTALKVALVTLAGTLRWQETHPLATTFLPGGGAVQDAQEWWQEFLAAGWRGVRACGGRVAAVAVTGQWASTVPVDAEGVPVGPCVLWLDGRGAAPARARVGGPVAGYAPRSLASWVRINGGAPSLEGKDGLGGRWHLQTHEPAVHAAARWLLEPVDYLTFRLTGRATASQASMVGTWLTDNRRLDPGEYHPELVRRSGIDPAKLPPLIPNGTIVAGLRPQVAEVLGLPADVPVVAGSIDLQMVALGSGAVEMYQTHLSLGTTAWLSCHVPAKKTDVIHQIATIPSLLPERFLVLNNVETAGRALHWLRDVVSPTSAPPSFAELDEVAEQARPGSGSVLFTPWLAGERTPVADHNARGGWHNVSLTTTRADLVRSVLEGVALNHRWTLAHVEKFVGRRLDDIRLVGGGGRSQAWCQIHADVLDRRIEQVSDAAATAVRGAAFCAALALGAMTEHDVHDLVKVRRTYSPDPARTAVYDRLFAEFPGLYRRQKRMFARLNGRGGRPRTRLGPETAA